MKTCGDFKNVPGVVACGEHHHELIEIYSTDGQLAARVCGEVSMWISDTIAQHVVDSWVMPLHMRERCYRLRVRSKRGEFIDPDAFAFLQYCFKHWPEDYKAMSADAHDEAKPFGARDLR